MLNYNLDDALKILNQNNEKRNKIVPFSYINKPNIETIKL